MAYKNVPNEPHIKYNPVSKLYIVTRTVKGKSQYEGGITSLTKAKQIRDKFVKALPAETTAQTNIRTKTFSGNIDPKELNKASRFFYKRGEISSPYYEDLYSWVKTGAYWAGTAMTLGLSKFKWTKSLWNSTVEPYFIDLIDNTVGAAVQGFINGLKSDK